MPQNVKKFCYNNIVLVANIFNGQTYVGVETVTYVFKLVSFSDLFSVLIARCMLGKGIEWCRLKGQTIAKFVPATGDAFLSDATSVTQSSGHDDD